MSLKAIFFPNFMQINNVALIVNVNLCCSKISIFWLQLSSRIRKIIIFWFALNRAVTVDIWICYGKFNKIGNNADFPAVMYDF